MILSPITLFVYNRPWHTQQTVEALQKNDLAQESILYIYSDAPKADKDKEKVKEVRAYIHSIKGFKQVTIIEREKNWGLANSIIDGVTSIVNKYGKIIVLEDDLVTSPYFLTYMNEGLEMYKDEDKVASIHGYIYAIEGLPTSFFIKGADCWGWATWKRAWDIFEPNGSTLLKELRAQKLSREINLDNSYDFIKMLKDQIKGKNDSWAVRWYISAYLQNKLTLYPGKSLIKNIGNDSSGTHCQTTSMFDSSIVDAFELKEIKIIEDRIAMHKIADFLKNAHYHASMFSKMKKFIQQKLS